MSTSICICAHASSSDIPTTILPSSGYHKWFIYGCVCRYAALPLPNTNFIAGNVRMYCFGDVRALQCGHKRATENKNIMQSSVEKSEHEHITGVILSYRTMRKNQNSIGHCGSNAGPTRSPSLCSITTVIRLSFS